MAQHVDITILEDKKSFEIFQNLKISRAIPTMWKEEIHPLPGLSKNAEIYVVKYCLPGIFLNFHNSRGPRWTQKWEILRRPYFNQNFNKQHEKFAKLGSKIPFSTNMLRKFQNLLFSRGRALSHEPIRFASLRHLILTLSIDHPCREEEYITMYISIEYRRGYNPVPRIQ